MSDGAGQQQARRRGLRARYRRAVTNKRMTRHPLRLAGPTFDSSQALEFMGFSGPHVQEGIASLREKRPPRFDPGSTF